MIRATRGWWLSISLLGCAQSDLVARQLGADECGGGPCLEASCAARGCESLHTQSGLCAARSSVSAGDSCGAEGLPLFRHALCSCTDLVGTSLRVDAFEGDLGRPAPFQAAIGVNGDLNVGSAQVDGPVYVRGRISDSGGLTTHAVPSGEPAPCQCAADTLLDVTAEVSARAADNDNAALGIDAQQLDQVTNSVSLELPCGRYFFRRIAGSAPVTLYARGNVALFVEGNVELDQGLHIQSDGSGQVTLFVAGEMRVGGAFSLGGDPSGSTRAGLYAGGQGTLLFGGAAAIMGTLYAPRAELVSRGVLELYGSAFARRIAPSGELVIHYDTASRQPDACL